jgi:hypothetical protein
MALGLLLSGCGSCGGWTSPWYKATAPGACGSDSAPKQAAIFAPLSE